MLKPHYFGIWFHLLLEVYPGFATVLFELVILLESIEIWDIKKMTSAVSS